MTPAPLTRCAHASLHPIALTLSLLTCKPTEAPPPQPPIAPPAATTPPEPTTPPAIATAPEPPPEASDHCKCPTAPAPPPDPAEASEDDDDDSTKSRRARARKPLPKPLATRLRAALPDHRPACDVTTSGPCFIHADFDGDARPDDAILVRNQTNAGGIAILWSHGAHDLLGAGTHHCWTTTEQANLDGTPIPDPCLEPIDPNLSWISHWQLLTRHPTTPPTLTRRPTRPGGPTSAGHPAPGALGDALLLDGGDAAAALYRTSTGWTLMHLGY